MEKTVNILLFESVAGRGFAFGKGENEVPEKIAADLVKAHLAEYIGAAAQPHQKAEKATSKAAQNAEKR